MSSLDHQENRSRRVRMLKASKLVVLTVLIAPILILAASNRIQSTAAAGANNAAIWLDGPSQAEQGETISYDIKTDASGLYGLQFELKFDPAVLQAVDTQLVPGSCPVPDFVVTNTIDNGSGSVSYAASSLAPTLPCDGGIVASLQFEVSPTAAGGNTLLHFESVIMADDDGMEIPASTVDLDLAIALLNADFKGTPTSGPAPLVVIFTNLSTGSYDTCTWNFGDNSTSNSCANPVHTYAAPGSFTVSLLISSGSGSNIENKVDYIVVTEKYDLYLPVTLSDYP